MTKDNYIYCLITIAVNSEKEGTTIAKALLTENLAACVSLSPINSFYTWQNKIHQDREWQLQIKTRLALFERLADRIKVLHSYDVPEIIAIPIVAGDWAYLNWIAKNTRAD